MEKMRQFFRRLYYRVRWHLVDRRRFEREREQVSAWQREREEYTQEMADLVAEYLEEQGGKITTGHRTRRYAKGSAASFRLFMLAPADDDDTWGFAPSNRLEADDS